MNVKLSIQEIVKDFEALVRCHEHLDVCMGFQKASEDDFDRFHENMISFMEKYLPAYRQEVSDEYFSEESSAYDKAMILYNDLLKNFRLIFHQLMIGKVFTDNLASEEILEDFEEMLRYDEKLGVMFDFMKADESTIEEFLKYMQNLAKRYRPGHGKYVSSEHFGDENTDYDKALFLYNDLYENFMEIFFDLV